MAGGCAAIPSGKVATWSTVRWQQSMPEPDFVTLLRRQGRLRLRHRNGVALSEAAVDEIIVLLLGVVGRVSATMRASAARRQHAA